MSAGLMTGPGAAAPPGPREPAPGGVRTPAEGASATLEQLSGAQRAAALLLLLGETEGAAIWRMLDEDEVRKISHAMVQLGTLEAQTVERLIVEFVSRLPTGGAISANFERTETLLLKIFPPEQVSSIMGEIRGASAKRVWSSLTQIDPAVLAAFLRNEYPQTVAVVLSRVRPDYAAKVLALLPEDFAVDTLGRMLRMETVQKEALRHIEETLRVEFDSALAQTTRRDAHEVMADVFNAFDRQTETRFLTALDRTNRGAAKRIREKMFTFEDLLKLDPGSVQTLLRRIDNAVLCRALKGADEAARSFFLAQMSTRGAKNLTEEIATMGPLRLREVDEAQSLMTETAKELAEKGEIMIAKSTGEEELVY